ncbi:MAG: hypothetical protein Q8O33_14145 [Pseudomonadota bacterium]|nr:hypothetical protein [Pseudomonadota bacterium]
MKSFDHAPIVGNATGEDVEHALDIMSNLLHRGDVAGLETFADSLAATAVGAGQSSQTIFAVARLAREITFYAWGTP